MSWRDFATAVAATGFAALAGCSLAPVYRVPDAPAPASAFNETPDWKAAAPADASVRGPWWAVFQDPELDALEAQVTDANQDLKAAFARLQQARAQTRAARSAYFPVVTAGPDVARTRASVNSYRYVSTKPSTYNDFLFQANASYEVDLWGRIRNTVEAARASEQASAGDLAVLDLTVRSELAVDYFTLRNLDAQQQLLERTVVDYERALQLTRNLYEGGAGVISDVQQAQAQLETARTQAEDTRLRRAQAEHAIAILIGRPATGFHMQAHALPQELEPPALDPGLPSALLERRPDVAAAERRVASANATIGVARAAYFPVFSLTAAGGFESVNASNWIEAPSRWWALGPVGLAQTVFDGGLRRAQTDAARAAYDEQVASYRSTVLAAYQEVEDDLASLRYLAQESTSEHAAVIAAQGAQQQAEYRYKGGAATYLEVVSTENAALAAQLSAADIQLRRMSAAVLLVKALGGGWKSGADTAWSAPPSGAAGAPAAPASIASGSCGACIELARLWSLAGPYRD